MAGENKKSNPLPGTTVDNGGGFDAFTRDIFAQHPNPGTAISAGMDYGAIDRMTNNVSGAVGRDMNRPEIWKGVLAGVLTRQGMNQIPSGGPGLDRLWSNDPASAAPRAFDTAPAATSSVPGTGVGQVNPAAFDSGQFMQAAGRWGVDQGPIATAPKAK